MDFGRVLTRSWEIIWKNKILWLFGILASCASGGGGGGGGSFGGFDGAEMQGTPGDLPPQFEQFGRGVEQFFANGGWVLVVGLVCLILLISLIAWAIGIFGKVGLIRGVLRAESDRPISFSTIFEDAKTELMPALGLNLLLAVIALGAVLAIVAIGLPLGILTLGIGLICLVCLAVPLAIAFNIYSELANVALIKDGQGVSAALSKAWDTLRSQPGPVAVLAVILFIVGLLASVVIALPLLVVFLPFLFTIFNDPNMLGQSFLIAIGLFVLMLPVVLLLQGILTSYVQSAWTLGYLELDAPAAPQIVEPAPKPRRPRTPKAAK